MLSLGLYQKDFLGKRHKVKRDITMQKVPENATLRDQSPKVREGTRRWQHSAQRCWALTAALALWLGCFWWTWLCLAVALFRLFVQVSQQSCVAVGTMQSKWVNQWTRMGESALSTSVSFKQDSARLPLHSKQCCCFWFFLWQTHSLIYFRFFRFWYLVSNYVFSEI